ncbi:23S rRNA (pseudouridine(1915)-N(3))-methyltransferase RlmH [Cryomorphaceae bacterium 1068]|nr:23S rRNA (pseudouridine(1915)-N(3))-methyltransferase RlmH [Cryomorphaceae bacterium 1068]
MKIALAIIGQTDKGYLETGFKTFTARIKRYVPFEEVLIPEEKKWKKLGAEERKRQEAKALLWKLDSSDMVILLDEKGKQYTSEGFAEYLQKKMNAGPKRLVFVIGGAFGFDQSVYDQFPSQLAFSKMTFSHQMIRLFTAEQIYRAFTILNNEPYHNS